MHGWEVLRGRLFVPGVFHGRGRPPRGRTTGLRLVSVLVKSQSMVHDSLGLLYRWPLEMQFVLLLLELGLSL